MHAEFLFTKHYFDLHYYYYFFISINRDALITILASMDHLFILCKEIKHNSKINNLKCYKWIEALQYKVQYEKY